MDIGNIGHTISALQDTPPTQPLASDNDSQAELISPQAQQNHLQPAATAEQAGVPADMPLPPLRAADVALAGPELHQPGLQKKSHEATSKHLTDPSAANPVAQQQPAALSGTVQAPAEASRAMLEAFTRPVDERTDTGMEEHGGSKLPHAEAQGGLNGLSKPEPDPMDEGAWPLQQQHMGVHGIEKVASGKQSAALPFHPEQSLQQIQQAADDGASLQFGDKASLSQAQSQQDITSDTKQLPANMHEQPDRAVHEGAPSAGQISAAIPEQNTPLQIRQSQATQAVRSLDDIMSEYESPTHHGSGLQLPEHLPPAAPADPSQYSTEHGAAQGALGSPADQVPVQGHTKAALAARGTADNAAGAHAAVPGHDEHMIDAGQTGLQCGPPAETPDGGPLLSKVRFCSCWSHCCYACTSCQDYQAKLGTRHCPHTRSRIQVLFSHSLMPAQGSARSSAARRQEIKPESDSGSVIWAKTKGYPWWPAQVLLVSCLMGLRDCASIDDADSSPALCRRGIALSLA